MSSLDTIEQLDRISRSRALTDEESRLLERALKSANFPRRARPVKQPTASKPGNWSWSYDADVRFFDAIADGMPIAEAGRLVGKNNAASQGRFNRARRAMGWQAS